VGVVTLKTLKTNNMAFIRFYNPDLFNRDENSDAAYEKLVQRFNHGFHLNQADVPAANIMETETAFQVEMAMPGIDKKNIRVEHEKGILTIRTEKSEENKEKEDYTRKEFDFAGVSRTFRTGEKIDADNISARYENGVLTVQLPKKEAFVKPARMISVE
jgi:HSP20 family protein